MGPLSPASSKLHGWADGGGDFLPERLKRALGRGSHRDLEMSTCDETPDESPVASRLPSLRLTPPDDDLVPDPDKPDSDDETCYDPDEDEERDALTLADLSPPDPSSILRQRRQDLTEKLGDTQYPRPRTPGRARPETHHVLAPSRLRPRPLPPPRPRIAVPASGIRSTRKAHAPTASQIRRDLARSAARGHRWDRVFRATFDEGVRAGYRAGHGHKVVAYAILQGGRTMDWTLDEWHARRFWKAMRGGYGRGVEAVLMGEAREAEREVEEAWMAEEGEYEWREREEHEDGDEEGAGDEETEEGTMADGEVAGGGQMEDMEVDERECEVVWVLDGVGSDEFEFVERWEAEDELEEGKPIETPDEMANDLEEGVLVETPQEAERCPAARGLFTLCRR